MEKRIRDYVKYTREELENYTKLEGSCVKKVNSVTHLSFPPHGLGDIHGTLVKIFSKKKIGVFDPKLQGIILEIRNMKVLDNKGLIHFNSVYSHMDVQADFYIFQPTIGSIVKGIIKHVSDRQIGVIIYRVFSVAIKLKDISKSQLEINSEIEIRIKNFDLENLLPYIEGELIIPKKISGNRFNENLNQIPIEKYESIHLSTDSSDDEMDQIRNKNSAVLNVMHQLDNKEVRNTEKSGKTTFEISSSDDMSSDQEPAAREQLSKKKLDNLSAAVKHEPEKTTYSDTDDEDEDDNRNHTLTQLSKKKLDNLSAAVKHEPEKTTYSDTDDEDEDDNRNHTLTQLSKKKLDNLSAAVKHEPEKTTYSDTDDEDEDDNRNHTLTQLSKKKLDNLSAAVKHEPEKTTYSDTDDEDEDDNRNHTLTELQTNLDGNRRKNTDDNNTVLKLISDEDSTDDSSSDTDSTSKTSSLIKLDNFPVQDIKQEEELIINSDVVNVDIGVKEESLQIASKRKSDRLLKLSSPDIFASTQCELSPTPNLINNKGPSSESDDSIFERNARVNFKTSTQKATPIKEEIRTPIHKGNEICEPSHTSQLKNVVKNSDALFNNNIIPIKQEDNILSPRKADRNLVNNQGAQHIEEPNKQIETSISRKKDESTTKSSPNVKPEKTNLPNSRKTTPKGADKNKMIGSDISAINEQIGAVMEHLQKSGIETSKLNESESSVKKTSAKKRKKSSLITTTQDSPTISSEVANDVLSVIENFKVLMNLVKKNPVLAETSVALPTKKKPAAPRKRKASVDNVNPSKKPKKQSLTKAKIPEIYNETAALAALSRDSQNRSRSESISSQSTQAKDETGAKKPKKSRKKPEPKVSESDQLAVDLGSLTTSKPVSSAEAKTKNPKKPKKKAEPTSSAEPIQPKPPRKKYERKKKPKAVDQQQKINFPEIDNKVNNIKNIAASNENNVSEEALDGKPSENITDGPKKKIPVRRKSTAVRKSLLESNTNETKISIVQPNSDQVGIVDNLTSNLTAAAGDSIGIKPKRIYKRRESKTKNESVDKKQKLNLPQPENDLASSKTKVNGEVLDQKHSKNISEAPENKTPVQRKSTEARLSTNESVETKIPIIQPNSEQIDVAPNLAGPVIDSTKIKTKKPYKKREPKKKTESVDKKQEINLPKPEIKLDNIETQAPKKKTTIRRKPKTDSTNLLKLNNKESTEIKIPLVQSNGDQIDLTAEPPKKKAPARRKSTTTSLSLTKKKVGEKPLDTVKNNTTVTTDYQIPIVHVAKPEISDEAKTKKPKKPRKKAEPKAPQPTVSTDSLVEQKWLELMKQTFPTTDTSSLKSNDIYAALLSKFMSDVKTSLSDSNSTSAVIKPARKRKSSSEKKPQIKKSKTTPATFSSETDDNRKSVSFSNTTNIKDAPDGSLFLTPKMSSTAVNMRNVSI